jgi:hypothetical protein
VRELCPVLVSKPESHPRPLGQAPRTNTPFASPIVPALDGKEGARRILVPESQGDAGDAEANEDCADPPNEEGGVSEADSRGEVGGDASE